MTDPGRSNLTRPLTPSRRGGRVVECARLESAYTARYRGFESPPLRHFRHLDNAGRECFFRDKTGVLVRTRVARFDRFPDFREAIEEASALPNTALSQPPKHLRMGGRSVRPNDKAPRRPDGTQGRTCDLDSFPLLPKDGWRHGVWGVPPSKDSPRPQPHESGSAHFSQPRETRNLSASRRVWIVYGARLKNPCPWPS